MEEERPPKKPMTWLDRLKQIFVRVPAQATGTVPAESAPPAPTVETSKPEDDLGSVQPLPGDNGSDSEGDLDRRLDKIESVLKSYKTASPLDVDDIVTQWMKSSRYDWWWSRVDLSPLLSRNREGGGEINDQSYWYDPLEEDRYGMYMDWMGPSLLFRDETFQTSVKNLFASHNRPFPNLLACVTFTSLFDSFDVSIACLCSMMIQMLQSYQQHTGIDVYSLFLYGFTYDLAAAKCTPTMPDLERLLSDRLASIKQYRQQNATKCSAFRMVFLCGVNDTAQGDGHWILVAFDFVDETMQTAKAFCFPEWMGKHPMFDSLMDFIAQAGRFTISERKTIWIASQQNMRKFKSQHPGVEMRSIQIACGYTMLRHLMVCSIATTVDLSDINFEVQLNKFEKDYFPQFLVFFAKLWSDLQTEKNASEDRSMASIENWKPPNLPFGLFKGSVQLEFLLISGAYMSPCLDFSDKAVPFDILTVEFDGSSTPKAVSLRPRYYCNFEWSDTRDAPKRGVHCNMQTEANMLLDMMGELHRRLSFIERNS